MTEAELLQAVRDIARMRGFLTYHTHRSDRSEPGFPDLVCVHPRTGDVVIAELKAAKGRVSAHQQTWLDALNLAGLTPHVWRPADLTNGHVTRALTPSDMPGAAPDARELLRRVVMDYAPADCPPGCGCSAATARRYLERTDAA